MSNSGRITAFLRFVEDDPTTGGGHKEDEKMREGSPQREALGGSANTTSEETNSIQMHQEGEESGHPEDQAPPRGMPPLQQPPRVIEVIKTVTN